MSEALRPSVAELVALGRMPTDQQADAEPVKADRWEAVVGELYAAGDVTDAEAAALVQLLPEDDSDSYGVAWTLVHVIESAPGWPVQALSQADGPWADVLRQRLANASSDG
jgi:hypothetical protein